MKNTKHFDLSTFVWTHKNKKKKKKICRVLTCEANSKKGKTTHFSFPPSPAITLVEGQHFHRWLSTFSTTFRLHPFFSKLHTFYLNPFWHLDGTKPSPCCPTVALVVDTLAALQPSVVNIFGYTSIAPIFSKLLTFHLYPFRHLDGRKLCPHFPVVTSVIGTLAALEDLRLQANFKSDLVPFVGKTREHDYHFIYFFRYTIHVLIMIIEVPKK